MQPIQYDCVECVYRWPRKLLEKHSPNVGRTKVCFYIDLLTLSGICLISFFFISIEQKTGRDTRWTKRIKSKIQNL